MFIIITNRNVKKKKKQKEKKITREEAGWKIYFAQIRLAPHVRSPLLRQVYRLHLEPLLFVDLQNQAGKGRG